MRICKETDLLKQRSGEEVLYQPRIKSSIKKNSSDLQKNIYK